MQLHPDFGARSVEYAASCITRGIIGLDFNSDIGDLRGTPCTIPDGQKGYRLFESEMEVGDHVLVQSHHYPLALVEIASDYAYIPNSKEAFGIWCRHIRMVRNTSFYADYVTNPLNWERIPMTDTISPLRDSDGKAFQLIDTWLRRI